MKLTILLGFVLIIDLFLLLWIAVGMVKDKRLLRLPRRIYRKLPLNTMRIIRVRDIWDGFY